MLPDKLGAFVHGSLSKTYYLSLHLRKPYYNKRQKHYQRVVQKLKEKEKIKVSFFLIHESIWKYERVYQLLAADERFEPLVVICPYTIHGDDNMYNEMNQAYTNFKAQGYNVVKTYNEQSDTWLDVKKEINPDIVFFTNPHKLTKPEYYINNFLDCLTCYVPYAFVVIHSLEMHYNQPFHNLLWRGFYETPVHLNFARKLAVNKGSNVSVTGYPGIDSLLDKDYKPEDPWKLKDRSLKRIVWAPHHSIEGDGSGLDYSNFQAYCQFFLQFAQENKDRIQMAFKPHPLLRPKLYKNSNWGKARTDAYYAQWETLPNGLLNESEYIDLFLTSDAMIHDSASFVVEYLYTRKPVMFTVRDEAIASRFNKFGKLALSQLYHGKSEQEIVNFIDDVVIGCVDGMKNERMTFMDEHLIPLNNRMASENIYTEIKNAISPNK
jgi:hypothetical protein